MLLHITNGDCAGEMLKQLWPAHTVLPWRDALHDGPLLPSLEELSPLRAAFLAGLGWLTAEAMRESFQRRDAVLARYGEFEETVLWFEHDLYDQLQLLQLLHWFSTRPARLTLVQAATYLGPLQPEELAGFFPLRKAVSAAQLELGSHAWLAVCSEDPRALEPFLEPQAELPFLVAALLRYCEDYPWLEDGLTRTERTIAALRAQGLSGRGELFRAFSEQEAPLWMGDDTFFLHLEGRLRRETPWRWDATRRRFVLRPA
ncbi:MAG: DUF1835 domain-containing protein [Acidobacteria bacterium]|nr:DUF1835 domain-containing protein [Acidobacteriota bacterium]